MCLAVPARVVSIKKDEATVDLGGTQVDISCVLTPEVRIGGWVLVHAGFSIATIEEKSAKETWAYLKACYEGDATELLAEAGSADGGVS